MEAAARLTAAIGHEILVARADSSPTTATRPPVYKAIGISLAISSGVFIGISFVLKKKGLLSANVKYDEEAGEGYGYLKNAYWWTGMTLMIIGEICNFVAYAFVDAILVTPLGALSVVITTVLSAIFLKERLSFVGKAGCFICIIGSIIIVLNAPAQSSAATIQEMQHFVIAPGFLTYTGIIIIGCAFVAFWVAPRYGKKSMLVYLTICSLIGGLSVVATQGLGSAVVAQAGGTPQFNQWFLYVLLVFVVATLVTEIIFLNKALNIFNAALVTPTYYVYFTSATIVSSAILFRGFKGSPSSIATIVMGFLQICTGVVLLQLSKSAKDVPDAAVFTGDLDQMRTVAEQEEPEFEPRADTIRGAAGIVRKLSNVRQKREVQEAKRVYDEKMKDQMEPIGENEQVEWDGLRRRKTIKVEPAELQRRKSLHPPLGLTKFPSYDEEDAENQRPATGRSTSSGFGDRFFTSFRRRPSSTSGPNSPAVRARRPTDASNPIPEGSEDFLAVHGKALETIPSGSAIEMDHVYGLPPSLQDRENKGSVASSRVSPGTHHGKPIMWAGDVEDHSKSKSSLQTPTPRSGTRRQFSFQNLFHRSASHDGSTDIPQRPIHSRGNSISGVKAVTEEERMGLVHGDSRNPSGRPSDEDISPESANRGRAATVLPVAERDADQEGARYNVEKMWSESSPDLRTPGKGRPLPKTPVEYDSEEDGEMDAEKSSTIPRRPPGNGRDGGGNPPAFI